MVAIDLYGILDEKNNPNSKFLTQQNPPNMKKTIKSLCLIVALFLITGARAQLTGTYNVPSTFTSVAAAINSLNVAGVSGAVTIEVTAGYTETVTAGGFTLNTITGASSANTITFMKSGSGANPMLVAYTGGTAVPSSDLQDGVWKFVGSDYITIDGIDISDPNTSNPATMEFGFGFFKASATNGCQNNTIKNCHITLNRVNNDFGSSPAMDGSRGIDMVNAQVTTHTTAETPSSAAGANSNNKFYSNIIENCNFGITITGYADSTPFSYADTGNDIGGSTSATGNTIINFGGGSNAVAAAVRTERQYNLNVSYNVINNNNGSGIDHQIDLRGIHVAAAQSANASITNNTVTLSSGATSGGELLIGIQNASGSTAASNSIIITNNLITSCTFTGAVDGVFYGIQNSASAAYLSISNNQLLNNSTDDTGYGTFFDIYNSGAVTTSVDIANNLVDVGTFNGSGNSIFASGIYNAGGSTTSTISITTNTLQNVNFTGAIGTDQQLDLIKTNTSRRGAFNFSGNIFNNISVNSEGDVALIHNASVTRNVNVNNNAIVTGFSASTDGWVFGYLFDNSPISGSANAIGNSFSNVTYSGQGSFWGIYHSASIDQIANVSGNTISNINAPSGRAVGIQHSYGNSGSSVSGNTMTAISADYAYGLFVGYDSGSYSVTAGDNLIHSVTTTDPAGEAIGLFVFSGDEVVVTKNKIYDIIGNGNDNYIAGMYISYGGTVTVANNLVGDIKAPTADFGNLWGIYAGDADNTNLYYNTINIAATSSGLDFGSTALYTSDYTKLDMRNNIVVNTSTATGTGTVFAHVRPSSDLSNLALTTNNNLYYAGTPSAANLMYYDGTSSVQTLNAYKIAMGVREALSVTENPPFISITGSTANYLDLSTSIITQAESAALPVAGITTDFGGTTRNATTPDIGAWEGTYLPFVCTTAVGGTLATSSATICAGQTITATSNDVSFGIGTTYQWKVGATAGGPYAPLTGGTGSNTPNYTSDPLGAGVYYVVLETACPALSLTALSNEGTLTVNALPTATASVNTSSLCAGQNFSLTGSGSASTYMWSGPNGYTSTTQSPSFAAADATISGTYMLNVLNAFCSSAPASVFVKVYPYPATPTITAGSASICPAGSTTLVASGVVSASATLIVGTEEFQNSNTDYPAPYSVYYGGQKMQMLVLASELYAAGFVAGSPLTSIQFPVVSLESNWGSSLTENQNFQVSIGTTTNSSLTNFETGLTTVVAPSNFTPAVGYGNTHNFSSAFLWNGSENVVIETTFSNFMTGTSSDAVIQYNTSTSFQSTILYRADGETALAVASATDVNSSFNARPDFKLNGTSVGSMVWSPLTGLSGITDHSVVASPAATTVYSLTASLGGCASTASIEVTVLPVPVLTVAATSTAVCPGDASTLTVSGATSFSWNPTTTTNTISVTPSSTTVYTVMGQNQNCAVVSETISISTFSLPVVTAATTPSVICSGQSATLTANGAATYIWVSGPSTNSYVVSPTSNTTYSVTGTSADGCIAQAALALTVNSGPPVTVSPATVSVCMNATASFTAAGATTYSWTTGATTAMETVTVSASGVYTVTGISNGCATSKTVAVTAFALPVVNVSPASPTICTGNSVVLTASGGTATYSWTSASAGGASLSVNPTANTSYTVTGVDANNCSTKKVVSVIVDACTGIDKQNQVLANVSLFPNPSTGLITANFGFEGTKEILVLNSVGAKIYETSTNETSTNFDLSGFAKGVYFVSVKSNNSAANYKIVIQ
ncbi:hypothetical protein CNR22_03315 [Sphingobacteriaceae bacterium]|nr:hypothetical protein CNR22_03315 [Sphingobacteriaceae bacterium]